MSSLLSDYTVEVYIQDKRVRGKIHIGSKNLPGLRFLQAHDINATSEKNAEQLVSTLYNTKKDKIHLKTHQTYITRRNFMTGEEFQERYDTPHYCSPSSESYWST